MDKIKPYLFWIICGAILLVELILIAVLEPVNADNKNVYKAALELNKTVKSFKTKFHERTDAELPNSFAIDEVKYFQELQTNFLVSPSWMPGLQQVERDLQTHKSNVEVDLKKRSAVLHNPIKQTTLRADWYNSYEMMSAELLSKLRAANQLSLTGDPFSRADSEDEVLRTNAGLRNAAGFYTKGVEFPTNEEWPIITTRFRISEKIVEACLAAEGSLLDNQKMSFGDVNFVVPPEEAARPQLAEVSWGTSGAKWDSENSIPIKGGRAITCKVKFSGSATALLAVTAELEKSQSPIFIVHGSQWSQPKANRREAEKEVDSPIEMTLHLGILDYQGGQP